jgi:hypothetical protein
MMTLGGTSSDAGARYLYVGPQLATLLIISPAIPTLPMLWISFALRIWPD